MDSVTNLPGVESKSGPKTAAHGMKEELGKDDFLNLLVTQLKNQDPLNPSDPTKFTAQLAQYSSLEQLYNINDNLQTFDSLQGAFGRLSALSMIDKQVVSESDSLQFEGKKVELGFRFQDPVENAVIYIEDETGRVVHQMDVINPAPGENTLHWNGTGDGGQPLAHGAYSFTVLGTTAEGNEIQGTPLVESRVTGVDYSGSDNALLTTNGSIDVTEIIRVKNPTPSGEI